MLLTIAALLSFLYLLVVLPAAAAVVTLWTLHDEEWIRSVH